jgi:hypothetical protein
MTMHAPTKIKSKRQLFGIILSLVGLLGLCWGIFIVYLLALIADDEPEVIDIWRGVSLLFNALFREGGVNIVTLTFPVSLLLIFMGSSLIITKKMIAARTHRH